MRWEAVALELAGGSGIRIPTWNLQTIDGKAVLIVDRFDREGDQRIGLPFRLRVEIAVKGTRRGCGPCMAISPQFRHSD